MIDKSERKVDGIDKLIYSTQVERFRFACDLYRLPADARSAPQSERVPLRDWWQAWQLVQHVCAVVNADHTATNASAKPTPVMGGGGWKRLA